jgi:AraC family transcriptional regulator
VSDDGTVRMMYATGGLALGEFRCGPGHARWRRLNRIGAEPHVVFPHAAVEITQVGRAPLLADRNQIVFYNAGQPYRRALRHPAGDRSVFVVVAAALLPDLLAVAWPGGGRAPDRLPFTHGPSRAVAYVAHHRLVAHLRRAPCPDRLWVEETIVALVRGAVADAFAAAGSRAARARTRRAHRVLAADARALLDARLAEPLALADLARALHTSPFHLARVFAAETGSSLHAYRDQLRLREALDRVGDGERDLARLACELGYASHSHLTGRFRRAFGAPPSAFRPAASAEPSTIVEAAAVAAP